MGTWGEGLYDNDGALDYLGDLLQIEDEVQDIVALTVRIGLAAWLNPTTISCDEGASKQRVDALAEQLERLPPETRAALEALLADPEAESDESCRKPEAAEVIGWYCDGQRIDALLRFPGAKPIIDSFGEHVAHELDEALAPKRNIDLYEIAASMALLGLLIELAQAGLFQPAPARVENWRNGFTTIDKNTKSERGFWWKYVRKVQAGFDLLAPRPLPATPTKSVTRRPKKSAPKEESQPQGPIERYQHPKLGVGILVARTGKDDEEKLDLRFENGDVRKILAKFVTKIDE